MAATLISLVYYVPSMRVWMTVIPDDDAELDVLEAALEPGHAMERISKADAKGVHFVSNLLPLSKLPLLDAASVALVDANGNVVNVIMGDALLYNAIQAALPSNNQVLTPNSLLTAVESAQAAVGGTIVNGVYTPPPQAPDPNAGFAATQQAVTP